MPASHGENAMRSLSYILTGKCSNLDDCVDYAMRHKVQRIIVSARTAEEVAEQYAVHWLKGTFVWMFDDTAVTYDHMFGGCFQHEPAARQQLCVQDANDRLRHELESIRRRLPSVTIEGERASFQFPPPQKAPDAQGT
jgi:hypothetical protein